MTLRFCPIFYRTRIGRLIILFQKNIFEGDKSYIRISSSKTSSTFGILNVIKDNHSRLNEFANINSGCDITISKISNKHLKEFNNNLVKNEGVFVLSPSELKSLSLNDYEKRSLSLL